MSLTYTNIQHKFRKENRLTLNEYVICDMIFYLSKKSDSKVPNWCFMSKETMANEIGLSKQSIITLIKKLCESGFLEKQEVTGFVKTTSKWESVYFYTDGKESLPIEQNSFNFGKESLPLNGKESLPNNNTIYNNKESNNNSIDFYSLIDYYNLKFSKSVRVFPKKAKENFNKLLKLGYNKTDIKKVFDIASLDDFHKKDNYKYVTLEFLSRVDKFERYVAMEYPKKEIKGGHINY